MTTNGQRGFYVSRPDEQTLNIAKTSKATENKNIAECSDISIQRIAFRRKHSNSIYCRSKECRHLAPLPFAANKPALWYDRPGLLAVFQISH
jgi:hypothetical protein